MTKEELNHNFNLAASQVKLSAGIVNNAAWLACLDAHDRIKTHRNYRGRVKQLYKRAIQEFHIYENGLLYREKNRLFRVSDMSEATRKKYGAITDREYYEFWAGTGATAYSNTRHHVTALCNKYRLSLQHHGIEQPEVLAWSLTAMACLRIAGMIYRITLNVMHDAYKLPMRDLETVFGQLSLARVEKLWYEALLQTEMKTYELTPTEKRNIQLGVDVLQDEWGDTAKHLRITNETLSDYDDIFRTKGEMKKASRELSELEKEIQEEEEKRNYERRKLKTLQPADAE